MNANRMTWVSVVTLSALAGAGVAAQPLHEPLTLALVLGHPPHDPRQDDPNSTPEGEVLPQGRGPERSGRQEQTERFDFRAERTERETKTLALGPTGSLELRNVAGDIVVAVGSGRDVKVDIVRRGRARTDADLKTAFESTPIVVEQQGDHAVVWAEWRSRDRAQPFSMSVTYTVSAPAGTRVTALSVSGNVNIRDIIGDISARVVGGNIDIDGAQRVSEARSVSGNVSLSDITTDNGIAVSTVGGDVLLQKIRARRLDVDAIRGNVIIHDARAETTRVSSLSGAIEYAGELAPRGRYELNSHSGAIRFMPAGSTGFELQIGTFSGSVQVDPSVPVRLMGRGGRGMRGTVGDGSATVVLSTFSGTVTLTKK